MVNAPVGTICYKFHIFSKLTSGEPRWSYLHNFYSLASKPRTFLFFQCHKMIITGLILRKGVMRRMAILTKNPILRLDNERCRKLKTFVEVINDFTNHHH